MCGIAGIVGSQRFDASDLERMLDKLRHRGPDDIGTHIDEGLAIGQRRLSIIDLEGGRQPIANEDETLWIVCNGEIYNYRELRDGLEKSGHRFRTHSDSEVVLHLYEEMGDRCVERLRGMFAFAIWDARRHRLFAARDRLGQKPLYYAWRGNELLFASEIKALLAVDPQLIELDLEALDQYLALRFIAPPRSMFRQVRKLPPAHTLVFSAQGGLSTERYWDIDYEPKHTGSEDDLVDAFEEQLIECLRLHMVSDVPVGAFLSGGLDSTLLVALLMKHVSSEPLRTFSIGLPYRQFDEAPYARLVAEQYGTLHREKTVAPSIVDNIARVVWHLDEPSDPLAVCTDLIAAMAREEVKVVIGGDGGDELFGGYDRYYGHRYAGYYALLPAAVRSHLLGPMLSALPDGGWYKSRAHQLKWLHKLSFVDGGARHAQSLSYFYFSQEQRNALYGPAMSRGARSFDPYSDVRSYYNAAKAADSVDRMLYADSMLRLPDHPVMILDRMTMAHGLEARAPFMDHKLVEFAAKLPVDLKVRGRSLRYLQMRLARRHLPDEILSRPKQGFSVALPYLLKDEYQTLYQVFLQNSKLGQDGIINQDFVNDLISEHLRGRVDHGNRLWLLLNSEIWYQMFFHGLSKEGVGEMLLRQAA